MTDISSSIATISDQHPVRVNAPSLVSPNLNGAISDAVVQDDNEDYTIKCICSYGDDDGSTVYCERCDTWQHIICYYHGKKVPDVHFCGDCDPRPLDAKRATESQKRLREHIDGGDRKTKRPPTKSHKKKKDSIAIGEQTNGLPSHTRHDSAPAGREQPPPAKRAKTSHRASTSIASMNGVPTLPEPRKRASSNLNAYPSPTKSPISQPLHPPIPTYTFEFLNLYENDRGKNNIDDATKPRIYSNSMSMSVTNDLTSWYDNPFALKQATGRQHQEVFHQSDRPLRPETWPRVVLKEKKNTETTYEGRCPKWKCIILDTSVKKEDFIGEIRGDIGRLEDYCFDPDSRWSELRHPEPFVFFHPQIPIYIDSRAEGTQFRYVRRSCHPNVSLKTFVTGERDFHHCFVAKENISAGTELTAMWYIDQTLFNNGKVKEENGDEEEAKRRATYFSKILANFGDCACDSTDCWLKNFDLRTPPEHLKKRVDGRRWRAKAKSAASPPNTGLATNSRANSENVPMTEEDDQAESRSTSGSVRSKPHSRDITPTNATQVDAAQDPSLGMSAREKRKILMAEKAFEDQESKKQRSKRKRTSGGPSAGNPTAGPKNAPSSVSSLPATPTLTANPPHLHATSTSYFAASPPLSAPLRRPSNMSPRKRSAPTTPSPLSQSSRPTYVDRGTQTDHEPEQSDEADPPGPAPGWENCFETPRMRQMRMYREWDRRDQCRKEEHIKKIGAGMISPYVRFVPTWLAERREKDRRRMERRANAPQGKEDVGAAVSTTISPTSDVSHSTTQTEESKSATPVSVAGLSPYGPSPSPLPSQAAHTLSNVTRTVNNQRLQLSTLPPVPVFSSSAGPGIQAPTSFSPVNTSSVPQSPVGHAGSSHSYPGLSAATVAPSPVKKKLSLGEYKSMRSNLNTPIVEKTATQAMGSAGAASISRAMPGSTGAEVTSSQALTTGNPNVSIQSEDKIMGDVEESLRIEQSPPSNGPVPTYPAPIIATAQSANGPSQPPQLSNVLSNLQALARRGSSGGS